MKDSLSLVTLGVLLPPPNLLPNQTGDKRDVWDPSKLENQNLGLTYWIQLMTGLKKVKH